MTTTNTSSAAAAAAKNYEAQATGGEVVLLTGSSGCLGHQTLKLLLSHDERTSEIRCLDLRQPSAEMRGEIELELEKSNRAKRVEYHLGDIRDLNFIETILRDMKVSCIIHCAAKLDLWVDRHEQDADELEAINVGGTENLLKSCIRFGVSKFIHVSSYEIFTGWHTVYYATENTIPQPDYLSFGPSGKSKKLAELKVTQYANNKLRPYKQPAREINSSNDFLNAIIVRYTPIYGEYDRYFVSKYLKIAKFFSGQLQRLTHIWIRQQPIYVGNAAWALICAKNKMDTDESISGEDFHITDDTPIADPFDFLEQFLKAKNMRLSKSSLPGLPIFFLIYAFFFLRRLIRSLDVFNLLGKRRGRLQEAIDRDRMLAAGEMRQQEHGSACSLDDEPPPKHWWHIITPAMFYFVFNSLFLNRTKASLRLNYEPLFDYKTSQERSIAWYKKQTL